MRFVGVIPARYASTRLPGKALLEIAGRTLVEWVHLRACGAQGLDRVVVATDDARIAEAVRGFGGEAMMTRRQHASGSDRVAEVAGRIEADAYVNIQGDEPMIAAATIESVCRALEEDPDCPVSTACVRIRDRYEMESPEAVKVVRDLRGRALYFSRAAIPYARGETPAVHKHLGIYAFRRDFLLGLRELKPSRLERAEGLEQLRFLENGVAVRVVEVEQDSLGVDTPRDLERVRPMLENARQSAGPSSNRKRGKG